MRKGSMKRIVWLVAALAAVGIAIVLTSSAAGPASPPAGQLQSQPWDMYLFGGPGNQWALSIAVRGSQLFVGGADWDILHGRLRAYGLPLSLSYQWELSPWGELAYGLTPTETNLFVVGDAQPPACDAYDCAGDTEGKVRFAKYSLTGTNLGCWSYNFFPYCGGEHYSSSAVSNEGGVDYIYAVGFGEQYGWLHSLPFYLTKYTTTGSMINKVTEPGLGWGYPPTYNIGGSHAFGIVILNGYIYCAGGSRLSGYNFGEDWGTWDWGERPMVMKYDFNLVRQWKVRDNILPPYPGYSGEFKGITALGNEIYAVGGAIPTGGTGGLDFLIEKFDELGTRVWSASWGGPYEDVLTGVVPVGNRLFAVGYRYETADSNETTGEADAILFEINPTDGSILWSATFGGDRVDKANGIATDGSDLYIVGTTRSYASDEGNVIGQSEIMLIHYRLNRAPVADDQSAAAEWGVATPIELTASDEDGDDLTYCVVGGPTHGTLTGSGRNVTYTSDCTYSGPDSFTFKANDGSEDSNIATVSITVKKAYTFTGFDSPVDNLPIVNSAKAGSSVPVKWHLTNRCGDVISDAASFKSLTSFTVSCSSLSGDPTDEVETYAGGSGLQYLGDGYWQYNWKTPKSYAGQCRTMILTLSDGSTHPAYFKFK
jgi:hypothetical protein